MYRRAVSETIKRLASLYPCVGIVGPRQSGKTTLACELFPEYPYVSFENPFIAEQFRQDARAFVDRYRAGAVFDEVQHVPELFSYLQGVVDADKVMGRYIITSSQNFAFTERVTQSLAGRIAMITLLPLSLVELQKETDMESKILRGGYPRMHVADMAPSDFFPYYIQTYVERDVRQIRKIEDMAAFQRFIGLCAGRVGQLLEYSDLAQGCGVSIVTVQKWLSVLQASYIIFLLNPYHTNFNKRLTKSSKLYFYDTGLACSFLGIDTQKQLINHPLRGHLFENLAVLELLKGRLNRGRLAHMYFWRDQAKHEVDVIADWGGVMRAIEIKSTSTFHRDFLKGIEYVKKLGDGSIQSYVIYSGAERYSLNGMEIVPLDEADALVEAGIDS